MLYREISKVLGKYLLGFCLILCIPLGIALYYEFLVDPQLNPQPNSSLEFFETLLICIFFALLFNFGGRKAKGIIHRRESILLVVLIWFITAIISALPFYLTKTLENPVDAYFESMSGLTTTGASVICAKHYDPQTQKEIPIYNTNIHVPTKTYVYKGTIKPVRDAQTGLILYSGVEAVSKAVLFWRSFIQWLGGMGIVVLFLAILPTLALGGKFLFQMEVPGPTKETLVPRIKETASLLWKLYLGLTILEIFLLIWTNREISLLDAFCITFSNLSTGGYTIKNGSIGAYNNVYTEWIVIFFMLAGSLNFAIYFHIIRRKFFRIYEPDFFLFFIIALIASSLVTIKLINLPLTNSIEQTYTTSEAIRKGVFQAVSAQTSTGFVTANYDLWPFSSQLVMLLIMFVGGMSGSTAGGIKTSRFYILFKIVIHKIEEIFNPETIRKLKIRDREIDNKTAITVLSFFSIAGFFTILGTVSLVLDGIDPETAIGTIACMMNNIGIAFRAAGPTQSFAFFSPLSKLLSTFWMLLGRLEFLAILLLFIPSFWKRK